MTRAREQIISLADTPYYHCMARCVRRAFLFGEDSLTGRKFDHRKQWVVDKLAFLSDIFAIDVCAYAVMSNHYHVVLRVDVEMVESWSMDEVIERWTRLFAGNVMVSRYLEGETLSGAELRVVAQFAEQWRERLCDISWFMRVLNESLARMANEEDGVKGRFWEGRFKSQALLDEAAVLACMAYVDLNPIRAGVTELPEDSDYSSIQIRIKELVQRKVGRPSKANFDSENDVDMSKKEHKSQVRLFPFNHGFELKGSILSEKENALDFSLADYLQLIDWTGRALLQDKCGATPAAAPSILRRLGLSPERWLNFMPTMETRFAQAVGSKAALAQLAAKMDLSWLRGQGLVRI